MLPDGDWDTVAGWIIATLDRIPGVGDTATIDGHTLEVTQMDGFGIEEVVVRARRPQTSGSVTLGSAGEVGAP